MLIGAVMSCLEILRQNVPNPDINSSTFRKPAGRVSSEAVKIFEAISKLRFSFKGHVLEGKQKCRQ